MSATLLTPTTELEAVNTLLAVIGESPVETLLETLPADAGTALANIRRFSKQLQTGGWSFNREWSFPLSPNTDGEIELPLNTLKVVPSSIADSYVRRGGKLYDPSTRSFSIGKSVEVDIVFGLLFEELPEAARAYITAAAAKRFQDQFLGDPNVHSFTAQDEAKAWSDFLDAEQGADFDNIRDTSYRLQVGGWAFNTEWGAVLAAGSTGLVEVPADVLKVEPTYPHDTIVHRGNQLFDPDTSSATLDRDVTVDLVRFLPLSSLPPAARNFVMVSAARRYQSQFSSDKLGRAYTEADEQRAWAEFLASESGANFDAIREANLRFQKSGWSFNREWGVRLPPDSGGSVALPSDAIHASPSMPGSPYVQRGSQLFDPDAQSFSIGEAVTVDLVRFLPLSSLPPAARKCVLVSAGRQFQDHYLGDKGVRAFTDADEVRAWAEFLGMSGEADMESIRSASARLQKPGWSFNTEWGVELPLSDGTLAAPEDVLRALPSNPREPYVLRDGKLFDPTTSSYSFSGPVSVDLVRFLPLDVLPKAARSAVMISAIRRCWTLFIGDRALAAYSAEDEQRAWAELLGGEADFESIREANIRFQSQGWSFNRQWSVPFTPSGGAIEIAQSILKVVPSFPEDAFVQRGDALFDPASGSATFSSSVTLDVVYFLPLQSLPAVARDYVLASAYTLFLSATGDKALQVAAADESRAWAAFLASEGGPDLESIRDANIRLQKPGWSFNTEWGLELPTASGSIAAPAGTLSAAPSNPFLPYVLRDGKLYDPTASSFSFSSSVTVDLVRLLPPTELPQAARNVVMASATRRFAASSGGDKAGRSYEGDEMRAWAAFLGAEPLADMESVRDANARFQSQGWSFNTDTAILDPVDDEISLPEDALRADATDPTLPYVQRGRKLFDPSTGSSAISDAVEVDLVRLLPLPSLPESARRYVRVAATRRCWTLFIGDRALAAYSAEDEQRAWADFLADESENADLNVLTAATPSRILRSRRRQWQ